MIKKTMSRVSKPGTTTRPKRPVSRTTTARLTGLDLIRYQEKQKAEEARKKKFELSKKGSINKPITRRGY
jgi:hypothetical protein